MTCPKNSGSRSHKGDLRTCINVHTAMSNTFKWRFWALFISFLWVLPWAVWGSRVRTISVESVTNCVKFGRRGRFVLPPRLNNSLWALMFVELNLRSMPPQISLCVVLYQDHLDFLSLIIHSKNCNMFWVVMWLGLVKITTFPLIFMEIFCNASTLVSDWMQTEFVDENVMLVMFCSAQRCVFMAEGKRERWRLFPQQFSPLLSRYHPPSPDSPRRAAGFSRRSTIIAVLFSPE